MTPRPARKITVACCVLIFVGSSACGGSDQDAQSAHQPTQAELEAVWQETQPIIDEELAKEDARSAVRFPCTLYEQTVASDLLDGDVEPPMYAHEFKRSNDIDTGESISWQAEACTWSARDDGASLYVWVSMPEHFEDGRVSCNGINDDESTEALLGGKAQWEFLESFAWAKLLVCRDDSLFFLEIHDGPVEEASARDLALRIARQLVDFLPAVHEVSQ